MQDVLQEPTELIGEIGNLLVHDPAYLAVPWAAIALVVGVTEDLGAVRMHGYAYLDDGEIMAETPEGDGVAERFRDLARAMARVNDRPWKAALVQIIRATGHFTIQFELDDAARWAVTPDNWERMREALRPAD